MDIIFKSKVLEKIFNSEKELLKNYGKENSRKIMRRMTVLSAARNLFEVPHTPPDRRHQLVGTRKDQFAVDLHHPARLIFTPNHDPIPKLPDGGYDLSNITAIKILDVEGDYHS